MTKRSKSPLGWTKPDFEEARSSCARLPSRAPRAAKAKHRGAPPKCGTTYVAPKSLYWVRPRVCRESARGASSAQGADSLLLQRTIVTGTNPDIERRMVTQQRTNSENGNKTSGELVPKLRWIWRTSQCNAQSTKYRAQITTRMPKAKQELSDTREKGKGLDF